MCAAGVRDESTSTSLDSEVTWMDRDSFKRSQTKETTTTTIIIIILLLIIINVFIKNKLQEPHKYKLIKVFSSPFLF